MYLWISNEGDQFLKANSHFSINIDKLGKGWVTFLFFRKAEVVNIINLPGGKIVRIEEISITVLAQLTLSMIMIIDFMYTWYYCHKGVGRL